MNLLLDTNVLSEVRRPTPDPKILAWLDAVDEDRAFISVAAIALITGSRSPGIRMEVSVVA